MSQIHHCPTKVVKNYPDVRVLVFRYSTRSHKAQGKAVGRGSEKRIWLGPRRDAAGGNSHLTHAAVERRHLQMAARHSH